MKKKITIKWSRFHRKFLERKKLKFIAWFEALTPGKYCWADCVSWSFCWSRINPFNIDRSAGCEVDSKSREDQSCYCGQWNGGTCFAKLSKAEQEKIQAAHKALPEIEPPF